MSILSTFGKILGGPLLDKAIDLFKDHQSGKLTKEQLKFELSTFAEKNQHEIDLANIDVNKEDAKSGNFFQSGWRPWLGWVCGLAIANNYLFVPWLGALGVVMPALDVAALYPLLFLMLGNGGLRTFDKMKKINTK